VVNNKNEKKSILTGFLFVAAADGDDEKTMFEVEISVDLGESSMLILGSSSSVSIFDVSLSLSLYL
jgi:hypothetical protein